jgi:PTH2 family peptidyl-tRNA hydrolase
MGKDTKQVILVRTDIIMPPGKLAAQVAHASMSAVIGQGFWECLEFDKWENNERKDKKSNRRKFTLYCNDSMDRWLPPDRKFAKVVLGVADEKELNCLLLMARDEYKLPTSLIKDEGRTVFDGPTITCGAIGPGYIDEIDLITGDLRLY